MADHQVEHIQRRIAETWDKHRLAGTALSAAAAAFLVGWGVGNYYASQKRYYANLADLKQTFRLESNNGQGTSIASTARSESRRTTMMDDSPESQKLKMVIVARMDLKMGKGKLAGQCAHGAVGQYKKLFKRKDPNLRRWEECGGYKVVLRCETEQEFSSIQQNARQAGLQTHAVLDSGRTNISPNTRSILVLGPADATLLDPIVSDLKLLT